MEIDQTPKWTGNSDCRDWSFSLIQCISKDKYIQENEVPFALFYDVVMKRRPLK